jgi:hypothetical protein
MSPRFFFFHNGADFSRPYCSVFQRVAALSLILFACISLVAAIIFFISVRKIIRRHIFCTSYSAERDYLYFFPPMLAGAAIKFVSQSHYLT